MPSTPFRSYFWEFPKITCYFKGCLPFLRINNKGNDKEKPEMLGYSPTAQCMWGITGTNAVIDNVPILIIMVLITSMVTSTGGSARCYHRYMKEGTAGAQHGKCFWSGDEFQRLVTRFSERSKYSLPKQVMATAVGASSTLVNELRLGLRLWNSPVTVRTVNMLSGMYFASANQHWSRHSWRRACHIPKGRFYKSSIVWEGKCLVGLKILGFFYFINFKISVPLHTKT